MAGRLRSALLVSALTAPMPAPPARNFSFTDWQVAHPTEPPPGDKLDSNFDLTNLAITQQLEWTSVSINSDGTIRDAILDANNFVPGLFDDVSQGIIDEVQPLVTEAQSYASQSQISATNAEAEATSAAAQAANAGAAAAAAQAAAAEAEGSETAAAIAETAAVNARTAAENAAGNATGSEDQAMLFADLAGAWAEHMPDTIPPEVLAVNAITGDHWSSRWWANKANQAFGTAAWYYAGAGPTPPLFTVTGDPLPIGAIWFDTSIPPGTIRIWNGTDWIAAAPSSLPPNSINTIHLIDGCVTEPKLATGAVSARALADGAVDTAALQDGSVTSAKIANGTIDPVDLNPATLTLIATSNPFDQNLNKADTPAFSKLFLGLPARAPVEFLDIEASVVNGPVVGLVRNLYNGALSTAGFIAKNDTGAQASLLIYPTAKVADGIIAAGRGVLSAALLSVVSLAGPLLFGAGSTAEKMRLDVAGNIGLGRVPEAWNPLHRVVALGLNSTIIGEGNATGLYAGSNLWNDGAAWRLIGAAGGCLGGWGGGTFTWYTTPAGAANAIAPLTERMRLDIDGRLGLGRIPHPHSTVYSYFALGNSAGIYAPQGVAGSGDLALTSNSYYDGVDHRRILAFPVAAYYQSNGEYLWYSAPTGAAGSIAAFTERMRLDINGLLGIGNTAPGTWRTGANDLVVGNTVGAHGLTIAAQPNARAMLAFGYAAGNADGGGSNRGKIWYDFAADFLGMNAGSALIGNAMFKMDIAGQVYTPASRGVTRHTTLAGVATNAQTTMFRWPYELSNLATSVIVKITAVNDDGNAGYSCVYREIIGSHSCFAGSIGVYTLIQLAHHAQSINAGVAQVNVAVGLVISPVGTMNLTVTPLSSGATGISRARITATLELVGVDDYTPIQAF